jgi:hypothetical protein
MGKKKIGKKIESTTKKRKPWSFIVLILVDVIAIAFFSIYFLNLRYNLLSKINYRATKDYKPSVHYFKNKDVSLEKVLVRVFLFEPNDMRLAGATRWKENFEMTLDNVQAVHRQQFFNLSNLDYVIYPEIIQGKFSSQYYDMSGLTISPGKDEKQLNLIMDEINKRIESGELDKIDFGKYNYTYLVNQIFYTGSNRFDGGGGTVVGYTNEERNKNSSILFWQFLKKQNTSVQSSIVYHEILHTFGVPEGYGYDDYAPFADDVMGMGVISKRPIEVNFLSHEFKQEMGL